MLDKISELKSVRIKIKELLERESELSTPQVSDLSLLPKMYEIFCEYQREVGSPINGAYHRGKFVYVVLFLYSPMVLAGGAGITSVNKAIIKFFNKDRTFACRSISDVIHHYENYREFRERVASLYKTIQSEML